MKQIFKIGGKFYKLKPLDASFSHEEPQLEEFTPKGIVKEIKKVETITEYWIGEDG